MSDRTTITEEEAREILGAPGYDAYGRVRVYGIYGPGPFKGQIAGIKSNAMLDRIKTREGGLVELYATTNDGYPPIRKA